MRIKNKLLTVVILVIILSLLSFSRFATFTKGNGNVAIACTDYDQQAQYVFANEYDHTPYSWHTFYMCSGSLINRNETHWYHSSLGGFVVDSFSGYSYNNYTPYTITNYNVVVSCRWLEYRLTEFLAM